MLLTEQLKLINFIKFYGKPANKGACYVNQWHWGTDRDSNPHSADQFIELLKQTILPNHSLLSRIPVTNGTCDMVVPLFR